jgi:hypothetical protein
MEAPALKLNGVYHIKRDEEAGRDAIGTLGRKSPQTPSLRAKRSNPQPKRRMDCFVASLLAMTKEGLLAAVL